MNFQYSIIPQSPNQCVKVFSCMHLNFFSIASKLVLVTPEAHPNTLSSFTHKLHFYECELYFSLAKEKRKGNKPARSCWVPMLLHWANYLLFGD